MGAIVMVNSIHLPKPLLDAVDRRARALRISRRQLIIQVLERETHEFKDWTPGFFEQLEKSGPELAATVDEMLRQIQRSRS
jgi:hypothetical protein